MDDLEKRIIEAQNDSQKMNKLVEDYLPFVKRCVAKMRVTRQSQEDALTLAMLTFTNCTKTYEPERGLFLSYAETSIRNRLIDDFRAEQKFESRSVPLLVENAETSDWEAKLPIEEHQRQLERIDFQFEIDEVSKILTLWNTSFAELSKVCPKQKRTRAQCEYIATLLLKNEVWRNQIMGKHRLPNKEICDTYGVSLKILEKYRKYIATLCVIQYGEFPMLQAFLPMNRKGGIADELGSYRTT